jgi:hypothetical protein
VKASWTSGLVVAAVAAGAAGQTVPAGKDDAARDGAVQNLESEGVPSGTIPVVEPEEREDPAYWIGRMEQALLPQAALRALLTLERETGGLPRPEIRAELTRVQGPERIRSVLAIRSPPFEREVLKIVAEPEGAVERVAYQRSREPVTQRRQRHDLVLGSVFTYEDLGFVPFSHRAGDARVEIERISGQRIVRVETGPYGPYSRVVSRLDWDTALPRDVAFFDAAGALQRTVTYGDVARRGAHPYPMQIEALEAATGRRSRLRLREIEPGAEVYTYEFREPFLHDLLDAVQEEEPSLAGGGERTPDPWIRGAEGDHQPR